MIIPAAELQCGLGLGMEEEGGGGKGKTTGTRKKLLE